MSTGPVVALLDTVTFPELMTFLVIALVVLGPDKLPGLARSAGQWMQKARKMAENLQSEVKDSLDESELQSLRELGEFAVRPRAKLAEYARTVGTDPDDHTNGDAPAASAPTLPPLGVGPDNPMITNGTGPATGSSGDSPQNAVSTDATVIDADSVEATAPAATEPSITSADGTAAEPPATPPATTPAATPTKDLPAHLAGTRLATGGGVGDPTGATATDAPVMSEPTAEPNSDHT